MKGRYRRIRKPSIQAGIRTVTAMGAHVEVGPTHDGQDRGCDNHEVEEPVGKIGHLEVGGHFLGIRVEELRERLRQRIDRRTR